MSEDFAGVEERLRAYYEAQIREREEKYDALSNRFQTLFDGIQDCLVLLSPDLRILWSNQASAMRIGQPPEAMKAHHCYELFHDEGDPCAECPAQRSFASGRIEEVQRVDEQARTWNERAFPIFDADGRVVNVIKQMRDVSESVQMQAEMMRASHLASLGELAAGVAHEINNPINGIINYGQLLANRAAPESREAAFAQQIIKEGNRIAVIVRNLLSFARERRELRHPVTVGEVLSEVLALVETQLKRDGIALSVEIPEILPALNGIPHQLQQVFLNLVSNARYALNEKFPGVDPGKRLCIRAQVAQRAGQQYIRIVFEDRGCGIPKHHLDKVLNPFFTTKPLDKGTGLGLSISHGIIRNHEGRLDIESSEGELTRVVVDLPVAVSKEEGAP